jgi:tetratricopeptide (TPR) repeat protein
VSGRSSSAAIPRDIKAAFDDLVFPTRERGELEPLLGLGLLKPASLTNIGAKPAAVIVSGKLLVQEPTTAAELYRRGIAYTHSGLFDLAIADFDEVIRLDHRFAGAHASRGYACFQEHEYRKALDDYNEAIRLDTADVNALNGSAWIWSTCPDIRYRDGRKAVEAARKACELTNWKDAMSIDTLAAASAEIGDFSMAVKWQIKAMEALADDKKRDGFRARHLLYQQKKSYRQSSTH